MQCTPIRLMQGFTTLMVLASSSLLPAQDRKVVEERYRGKFVVVLKEGLAVGLCSEKQPGWTDSVRPILTNNIENGIADYRNQHGTFLRPLTQSPGCAVVVPEPIHKGEVLKVTGAGIINIYGRRFVLTATNVSPHAVQRGIGAFEHQSLEQGQAEIVFKLDEKDNTKEPSQAASFAGEWFAVFDTQDAAATFGNTTSGAFVREIKEGMTVAEVETVLGPPQTRIDLTEKVLYKYKDMTVEFRDGKVADVR